MDTDGDGGGVCRSLVCFSWGVAVEIKLTVAKWYYCVFFMLTAIATWVLRDYAGEFLAQNISSFYFCREVRHGEAVAGTGRARWGWGCRGGWGGGGERQWTGSRAGMEPGSGSPCVSLWGRGCGGGGEGVTGGGRRQVQVQCL